jgi:undecaprenyl-diphosphatase
MNWAGLLDLDQRLSNRARLTDSPGALRRVLGLLAHSGDSWFWLLGLAVLLVFGGSFWRPRALTMTTGVVFGAAFVMALKFTIRRRRPEGDWGKIYRRTDPHSFPSGHAARGMMLAIIALGLGPPWLGAILSIWAPLMALSRVAMGLHYLSDILGGFVVGGALGFAILRLFEIWLQAL